MFEWLRSRKIYKDGVYTLQRLPNFMTLRLLCIASVVHERFLSVYLRVMVIKLVIKVCSVNRTIYIRLPHRRGFNLLEHVLPIWAWSKTQNLCSSYQNVHLFPLKFIIPLLQVPQMTNNLTHSTERRAGFGLAKASYAPSGNESCVYKLPRRACGVQLRTMRLAFRVYDLCISH